MDEFCSGGSASLAALLTWATQKDAVVPVGQTGWANPPTASTPSAMTIAIKVFTCLSFPFSLGYLVYHYSNRYGGAELRSADQFYADRVPRVMEPFGADLSKKGDSLIYGNAFVAWVAQVG